MRQLITSYIAVASDDAQRLFRDWCERRWSHLVKELLIGKLKSFRESRRLTFVCLVIARRRRAIATSIFCLSSRQRSRLSANIDERLETFHTAMVCVINRHVAEQTNLDAAAASPSQVKPDRFSLLFNRFLETIETFPTDSRRYLITFQCGQTIKSSSSCSWVDVHHTFNFTFSFANDSFE